MQVLHRSETRGHAHHGWLESHHTFSFADYYDPEREQFGALRVLNDDRVAAGGGFPTHPHKDMEIVTIPLTGALQHKDSTGRSEVIKKGEVQIMSAGSGIRHSEFNASKDEAVTLLQIWVLPEKLGIEPRYEQKVFSLEDRKNRWQVVVSPDRREGSVWINQQAYFSLTDLTPGGKIDFRLQNPKHGAYFFVISGEAQVGNETLRARDALGLTDFASVSIESEKGTELLAIEIPML